MSPQEETGAAGEVRWCEVVESVVVEEKIVGQEEVGPQRPGRTQEVGSGGPGYLGTGVGDQ